MERLSDWRAKSGKATRLKTLLATLEYFKNRASVDVDQPRRASLLVSSPRRNEWVQHKTFVPYVNVVDENRKKWVPRIVPKVVSDICIFRTRRCCSATGVKPVISFTVSESLLHQTFSVSMVTALEWVFFRLQPMLVMEDVIVHLWQ